MATPNSRPSNAYTSSLSNGSTLPSASSAQAANPPTIGQLQSRLAALQSVLLSFKTKLDNYNPNATLEPILQTLEKKVQVVIKESKKICERVGGAIEKMAGGDTGQATPQNLAQLYNVQLQQIHQQAKSTQALLMSRLSNIQQHYETKIAAMEKKQKQYIDWIYYLEGKLNKKGLEVVHKPNQPVPSGEDFGDVNNLSKVEGGTPNKMEQSETISVSRGKSDLDRSRSFMRNRIFGDRSKSPKPKPAPVPPEHIIRGITQSQPIEDRRRKVSSNDRISNRGQDLFIRPADDRKGYFDSGYTKLEGSERLQDQYSRNSRGPSQRIDQDIAPRDRVSMKHPEPTQKHSFVKNEEAAKVQRVNRFDDNPGVMDARYSGHYQSYPDPRRSQQPHIADHWEQGMDFQDFDGDAQDSDSDTFFYPESVDQDQGHQNNSGSPVGAYSPFDVN